MFRSLVTTVLLASSALAYNISFINPTSGTDWTYSENQTVQWSAPTVDDPQNISLLIVNVYNQSMLPNYPTPLALNILSDLENFTMTDISIPVGSGYVILMTDILNSSNIYAQGGIFDVTESDTTDAQGSGFSIASLTTILSGGPAGGVPITTSIGELPTTAVPATIGASSTAAPSRFMRRLRVP